MAAAAAAAAAVTKQLAEVEEAAAPAHLFDILHLVAAHNPVQGNIAVSICHSTWTDTRIWPAIIEMQHVRESRDGSETYVFTASRLAIACEKGNIRVMVRLLELGANVDTKSSAGFHALSMATMHGKVEAMKLLLDHQANINLLDDYKQSSLCMACQFSKPEAARLLLSRGADVNLGTPPIIAACTRPCEGFFNDMTKYFLAHFWAFRLQIVRMLIDNQANVDICDEDEWTALMYASEANQPAIIEVLCEEGHANPDLLSAQGKSALYFACYCAHVEATWMLLSLEASVDVGKPVMIVACSLPTTDNQAAMDMATFWPRREEIVRNLVHYTSYSDVNSVDEDGWTPLMWASLHNQAVIINTLVKSGSANLDLLNNDNWTALYIACLTACVEATCELITLGADINLGDAPLIVACQLPHQDEQAGMDMSTFWTRRFRIVKRLISDFDIDLRVVDEYDREPVFYARRNSQGAIVKVLCRAEGLGSEYDFLDEEDEY